MKTFKDLVFGKHPCGNGLQAMLFFPNGYCVSVVRFRLSDPLTQFAKILKGETEHSYGSYTSNETEWELAVGHGSEKNWAICYSTPITDDVIGHLTEEQVTEVMKQVQELPVAPECSHTRKAG